MADQHLERKPGADMTLKFTGKNTSDKHIYLYVKVNICAGLFGIDILQEEIWNLALGAKKEISYSPHTFALAKTVPPQPFGLGEYQIRTWVKEAETDKEYHYQEDWLKVAGIEESKVTISNMVWS